MILDLIIFFLVIFIVYKLLQKHIVDEDFKDVVTEPEKPVTLTVDEYIPIIYDKTEVVVPYLDYTCKEYADYKFNKFLETEKELNEVYYDLDNVEVPVSLVYDNVTKDNL